MLAAADLDAVALELAAPVAEPETIELEVAAPVVEPELAAHVPDIDRRAHGLKFLWLSLRGLL